VYLCEEVGEKLADVGVSGAFNEGVIFGFSDLHVAKRAYAVQFLSRSPSTRLTSKRVGAKADRRQSADGRDGDGFKHVWVGARPSFGEESGLKVGGNM